MSKKSNLIRKGKYRPIIFSGWPINNLSDANRMDKHSRFQRDTHFKQNV